MSLSYKIYSLILAMVLTLGCAAAVSAQQSLTLGGDTDFGGLRWELQNGRYIIGLGSAGDNSWSSRSKYDQLTEKWVKVEHVETDVEILQLVLGSRLYLNQLRQKTQNAYGFFTEGNLMLQKLDLKYTDYVHPENSESKDRVDTSLSILVGYKFIFSRAKEKGFTLELAAGERFNSGDEFHDYEVKSNEGLGMLALGYTW